MAEIVLTFNTSAKQDAKLAKVLVRTNAQRVEAGEAEFETIEAYLRWVLIEAVKSYNNQQDDVDKEDVATAWDEASDAVKAQVEAILGI